MERTEKDRATARWVVRGAVIAGLVVHAKFCIVDMPAPWGLVLFTFVAFAAAFVLVFYTGEQ